MTHRRFKKELDKMRFSHFGDRCHAYCYPADMSNAAKADDASGC